ncbi:MAG TPA: hypothetical protein VFD82_07275 [Planctomycetota bacterium]|nr:hypothetical protein [Planctomycetota bacterium]
MSPSAVCFALVLAGALEAQSLWTVDITGATGFTTIQAAINAAADGDVIVIKSGNYTTGSFDVNDKALTFIEDAGAVATAVSARITNPNGKTVAIRGIDFRRNSPAVSGLNPGRNLHVIDNTGTVWLEDCTFETGGVIVAAPGPTYPAIDSSNSAAAGGTLWLTRCTVRGTRGIRTPQGMMQAGVAIRANAHAGDRLVLQHCVVEGGDGAAGFFPTSIPGGHGADAVEAPFGSVFAAGGAIAGGDGGGGGSGGGCTNAGDGGDGLVLAGVANADLLGTACSGGAPGTATGTCAAGVAGLGTNVAASSTLFVAPAGTPHSIAMTAPVLDGTSTTASYTGEPLAAAFAFASFGAGFTPLPGVLGPAALDLAALIPFGLVLLDAAGSATSVHALPDVLPPGMPVAVVFVQSLQFGTSALVAGAPSLLVIVQ